MATKPSPRRDALTLRGTTVGLLRQLSMDVRVGLPIGATEDGVIDTANVQTTDLLPAVWDTGATGAVITQKVVDQLGLSPISMAQVTDANSTRICPVYLVDLHLPNQVVMGGLNVTLQNLGSGLDVLMSHVRATQSHLN